MVDDAKKVDIAREDRLKDAQKEQIKGRPKGPSEFDKALERQQIVQKPGVQTQIQPKTATEEAIREAAKREGEHGQDGRREDNEKKEKRESFQKDTDRGETRLTDQKVVAKGKSKQQQGFGGGKNQEGYGGGAGRRELAKMLSKSTAKSVPIDLQSKFAHKLAGALKTKQAEQAGLTQQILNKIVQYVRMGINRKGEKELQLDLHERIFRGLKLRVVSREGKVGVYFSTSDKKGREVLDKESDAIRSALKDKGIEVDVIEIS